MAYQEILTSDSPNEGRAKINEQTEELYGLLGGDVALDDLTDVDTSTTPPTDGQALLFDEGSGLWLPGTVASGTSDHGALSGLSDDDHPQYLNETRGDARYVRVSGDPADGDFFEWDEASGMLVPTAAPSGGSSGHRTLVTLGSDVPNTTQTLANISGLSFSVTAGVTYRFEYLIKVVTSNTSSGQKWGLTTPAGADALNVELFTWLSTSNRNTVLSVSGNPGQLFSSTSIASAAGVLCEIRGIITPSASGSVTPQVALNAAGHTITVKAGSTVEYW